MQVGLSISVSHDGYLGLPYSDSPALSSTLHTHLARNRTPVVQCKKALLMEQSHCFFGNMQQSDAF